MGKAKLRIERIESDIARKWVRDWHYSHAPGNAQVGSFGAFDGDDMVGIVTVGLATNAAGVASRFTSLDGEHALRDYRGNIEITRVVVHPEVQEREAAAAAESGHAGATASRMLSALLKTLSTTKAATSGVATWEWVFSYADTGQGHHGGIYQATGFKYVGVSPARDGWMLDGKPIHPRSIVSKFGTQHRRRAPEIAARQGHELVFVKGMNTGKHTYIKAIARDYHTRKEIDAILDAHALPYPKRGDTIVTDPGDDPGTPAVASEENDPGSTGESHGQRVGTALGTAGVGGVQPRRLRPLQRVGAAFMAVAGESINGDGMGSGKTPQTIRAIQLLEARGHTPLPALIVCPNRVKVRGWQRRFAEWAPAARVVVAPSGTPRAVAAIKEVQAGNADVAIINYEALPNVSRLAAYGSERLEGCVNCDPLSKRQPARCQKERKIANEVAWRTVVCDEIHRVSSSSAIQTRALWALGDAATYRMGLTGTPPEEPDRLWACLRFMSPRTFPTKGKFLERYALMTPNPYSGFPEPTGWRPDTRPELDRILLPHFIRRPKDIMLPELPPKVPMEQDVFLTGKQLKAYNGMRNAMIAELDNGSVFAVNPLTEMTRLRQFASAYAELVPYDDGTVRVRLSEPSSKLDAMDEVLDELGPDRSAVIFAESAQLLGLAAARFDKRGIPYGRLVGGMSDAETETDQARFERGDARYMLVSLGAGAEGVDGLQGVCDVGIFLQRSWSRRLNEQAEDRLHRHGQSNPVLIIDLITRDTIEEDQHDALGIKDARFEDLVRDEDTLRRWLARKGTPA